METRFYCLGEKSSLFKNVLIHDDCIHIGAFNSSRAITRCAGYTKTSVCTKLLACGAERFILALDTTKVPDGVTSSHVLTIDCWQTINLDDQNDCPCQFSVEFLILWTCTKVVRQFILVENALYGLIL